LANISIFKFLSTALIFLDKKQKTRYNKNINSLTEEGNLNTSLLYLATGIVDKKNIENHLYSYLKDSFQQF
jgi:hypothetical protein